MVAAERGWCSSAKKLGNFARKVKLFVPEAVSTGNTAVGKSVSLLVGAIYDSSAHSKQQVTSNFKEGCPV